MSPAGRSFWKCLSLFHSNAADVAERVPNMPHTVHTDETSFTFSGTPQPFAAVMNTIMFRFPRPMLPDNPFDSAPAESWEAAEEEMKSRRTSSSQEHDDRQPAEADELRDPRRENTVRNLELSEAEMRAASRELAEEEFASTTPTRVEQVEVGQLYLCELEKAEQGLRLGLGMTVKEGPLNDDKLPTWTVAWFKIASKKGWKTKNIAFEQHKTRGQREMDDLDIRAFRLRIEDSDLTKVL